MKKKFSLGLGKTIFNSSACLLPHDNLNEAEIALAERFDRVKNSGAWPELPLQRLLHGREIEPQFLCENRDVQTPRKIEEYYNERFPFLERLKKKNLDRFSSLSGNIEMISHHEAHAWSGLLFSPFDECLLVILDGAGSSGGKTGKDPDEYEFLSFYRWSAKRLTLLDRKYLKFLPGKIPGHKFSEGPGIFYEKISEFIFNSKTAAGKVMGLAPFGKSRGLESSYVTFLEGLNWSQAFQGETKTEWDTSPYMELYQDLAATVQENFEHFFFTYLEEMAKRYPGEENLIITGGCALNCTFNGKLAREKLFKNIFVPSNPGDEGIGAGCAFAAAVKADGTSIWAPLSWEKLTSSRGSKASVPADSTIEEVFRDFQVSRPLHLATAVARKLSEGEVIAWFQGRSEIGPRALGNRSLLACPLRKGIKKHLNEHVKFREDFRPYGCTVQWEKAHLYFEVPPGFENPFMSFAVPVKKEFQDQLSEVSHVDGTSRMQTLHQTQNKKLHELLSEMEKISGLPVLLNTSLNVMGEPMVEDIFDAKRFLETSEVDTLVIQDYVITKK